MPYIVILDKPPQPESQNLDETLDLTSQQRVGGWVRYLEQPPPPRSSDTYISLDKIYMEQKERDELGSM